MVFKLVNNDVTNLQCYVKESVVNFSELFRVGYFFILSLYWPGVSFNFLLKNLEKLEGSYVNILAISAIGNSVSANIFFASIKIFSS